MNKNVPSVSVAYAHNGRSTKANALGMRPMHAESVDALDDEALLAELAGAAGSTDITELRHVRPRAESRTVGAIAEREPCRNFDRFQPLFQQTERELKAGIRQTRPFGKDASVETGNFFILGGQTVYVS